jgi:hypothetical protein
LPHSGTSETLATRRIEAYTYILAQPVPHTVQDKVDQEAILIIHLRRPIVQRSTTFNIQQDTLKH